MKKLGTYTHTSLVNFCTEYKIPIQPRTYNYTLPNLTVKKLHCSPDFFFRIKLNTIKNINLKKMLVGTSKNV